MGEFVGTFCAGLIFLSTAFLDSCNPGLLLIGYRDRARRKVYDAGCGVDGEEREVEEARVLLESRRPSRVGGERKGTEQTRLCGAGVPVQTRFDDAY